MNLSASIESALTTPPRGGFPVVSNDERKAIKNRQVELLDREVASNPTDADLRRERENVSGSSAAPAVGGLAASVEAALNTTPPEKKPAPNQKPNIQTQAPGKTFYNEAQLPVVPVAKGAGETALSMVSGIGSNIIGGWRGLAELARGGSMEDAANAVHAEVENRTYHPQSEEGKLGSKVMGSPYNPLNWWEMGADFAGAKTAQGLTAVGANPEVAAGTGSAVKTGIVAAPLLLLKGGKAAAAGASAADATATAGAEGAVKPRIKLKVQEPAAIEFAEAMPVSERGVRLPATELRRRAEVLDRVGVQRARASATEGNALAAADDFQQSKVNNPGGELMKATLAHEREALSAHAERVTQSTGGTLGLDESARMVRGNTIVAPLDALKNWYDTNISRLYKAADEKAGGVPVDLPEVHNFVKDHRADFLGTTEGKALLEGVTEKMRDLGMVDAEGNAVPVTVAQAERMNQYLGGVWTHRTGRLIREMKDSIFEGVTRNAGEDIYKQARTLRAMRASTLDDPKGIAKIMDASGPEGINRAVAVEKIADSVTTLPVEQLQHVVKTLKNVPKELAPQAEAALGEIKAQYANKVLEIGSKQSGQWDARGVTKYLRANTEKMRSIFTPEEMAKFADLNDAGHILAKDQSYPGAAVQEHNLVQRGAMASLRTGGAATGAAIAGPPGAAVGGWLGNVAADKYGAGASLRATQKRVVNIRDLLKKQ